MPMRARPPYSSRMSNKSPFLLFTNSERERAARVGIARMAVGATLMFPAVARRLFGIPGDQDTPSLRMLARLFAIRNIMLGTWVLMSRDLPAEQRLLAYRLNAAVDAVDVVALAWAGLTGEGLRQAAVMGSALGGSVLVGWIELMNEAASGEPEQSLTLA